MTDRPPFPPQRLEAAAAVFLLACRGILIWLLIPLATIAWALWLGPRYRVGLGATLGWADWNLVVLLSRVVVPRTARGPALIRLVTAREIQGTLHRMRISGRL